jgi:uncharacterized protein (UPF0264 family)
MTKWLASVQSLEEAQTLLPVLPDILDIKNPSKGALGALDIITVASIVRLVSKHCQTSATIGDLPMQAGLINPAMVAMAASGVDYVKVGIFPDQNLMDCLEGMANTLEQLSVPVIAVLFVDKMPSQDVIPQLKQSGFNGVMVDTAIKDGRHLLDHWDEEQLSDFINEANHYDLLCGLAGALRYEDIAELQFLGADYLGFRSALCHNRERTSLLQANLALQIQQAMLSDESLKSRVSLLQKG